MTVEEQVENLLNRFEVDLFELIGDEFAPKQEHGSPEREKLLGLIVEAHPLRIRAKTAMNCLLAEARKDELLEIGLIAHKHEGESPVAWQIADEIDERRAEIEAQLTQLSQEEK